MAKKMSITFDGFNDLAYAIDEAGGDLRAAVNEALTETQGIIENYVLDASVPYAHGGLKGYAKGDMFDAIITDAQIEWSGNVATVQSGFGLMRKGGWHSIFVMYGTPKMAKDQKVYNAIRGTKVRKAIAEAQQRIMSERLKLAKGD